MTELSPAAMAVLGDLVPMVAAKRHRVYPAPAVEDLEAELWLAAVEAADRVTALAAEGNEAAVGEILFRAARRIQQGEEREYRAQRAYVRGYSPTDEAFYSLGVLRTLLPAYLDGGVTEHPPRGRTEPGPVRPGDGAEYGNWLVMMMDIDRAMGALPGGQRGLLTDYFGYPQGNGGWTHLEIASAMGQEPETLRHRVTRGLKALQDKLGGASPYSPQRAA